MEYGVAKADTEPAIEIVGRNVRSTFTTHNGIVLEFAKVSRLAVVDAGRQIKEPKPPMVFIEDKGRSEDNPNDPDYLRAVQEVQYERGMVTITLLLALGTKIQHLPRGIEGPDGDEWLEILQASGIAIPTDNKRLRYCAWLKYIALPDDALNDLIKEVMRYSGLTLEEDVAVAQDNFRDSSNGNGTYQVPLALEG